MGPDEVPFVFDSWLNDWRTSKYAGVIPNHLYYDTTRTAIEDLIARGAVVLVAEYKGEVLAWVCGEQKGERAVLHYQYTKDAFRRHGLEEKLINALPGLKPGFMTFANERLLKDRKWYWTPEIARRQKL